MSGLHTHRCRHPSVGWTRFPPDVSEFPGNGDKPRTAEAILRREGRVQRLQHSTQDGTGG